MEATRQNQELWKVLKMQRAQMLMREVSVLAHLPLHGQAMGMGAAAGGFLGGNLGSQRPSPATAGLGPARREVERARQAKPYARIPPPIPLPMATVTTRPWTMRKRTTKAGRVATRTA